MRTRKAKDRSRLIQAAMGQIPCDLTIGNVQFFNVITGEIYPASVDILDGFVVLVREEGQEAVLPSKAYYDGQGRYLIPGYIDTHMHIESTMMIPENLARAILPWGTTTICTDPHEIGNVMGLDGVRFMLANAKKSRLRQYVLAPSCVPAVPGMHINLRASSLIDNLSFLVDGCKDQPWRDFVSVCTDDVHAKDLLTVGHINNVVRKAVASGLDGREVVKMATFNAAREYGFDDLGAIAPGYIADIQLVDALDGSRPKAVFTEGVLVAEDGKYLGGDCKTADYDLPNTVNMPQITGPASFELRVPEGYTGDTIRVNVMVSEDGNRILRHVEPVELPVRDGVVDISGDPTLVFVCCANRYGLGGKTIAVYRDFGLRSGALASTISHDSHNFTVSYHDPKDAFRAAEILRACGGGICVIDGERETHIALPAAGLMSQKPCAEVADEIAAVQSALDVISDGQLTLLATAIMALPVLPSVVITDMGLVNGANQTFVPVFADAEA